ncbi:porin [Aquincola sp. MAHUQ-54]|uniref:Porin n=1 Tax=Aquincola agrisoli TaxID=3119538 RepID=A0AAW9QKU4_9BURK
MTHRTLSRTVRQATCLGGALLPMLCAAQASNVTVYGIVDAAARRASNAGPDGASRVTLEDGIFTGSRLGFRVREDLGGGLSTLVTMESGFDPSSGTSSQASPTADFGQVAAATRFWGRDIHIGLRSSAGWGLTLGRQYTLAHQMAGRFQPQGNPNNLALSVFSSHHIARQDNVLKFDVKVAGIELAASRTLGEAAGSHGSDAWAVSAGYTAGPVSVGGYVQRLKNLADTEQRKIVGLGGNYTLADKATLFAGAMRRTNEASPQTNQVWTLGANYAVLPRVTLTAAYLHDKQGGSAALQGKRRVGYVSASYAFSKRSDVYAVIDHNRVEGGYAKPAFMGTLGSQTAYTLALRHKF